MNLVVEWFGRSNRFQIRAHWNVGVQSSLKHQKLSKSVHGRKSLIKKTFFDFQYFCDLWNNFLKKILDFYDENLGKIQNFRNPTNFDEL